MVREDISTNSSVWNINIWSVSEETENTFSVVYSVQQKITENKDSSFTNATYLIALYQDKQGDLVITQNPTLWNSPNKSDFTPEQIVFLETFFASYPTAPGQELTYYVKNKCFTGY
jgi:hypothetical protein